MTFERRVRGAAIALIVLAAAVAPLPGMGAELGPAVTSLPSGPAPELTLSGGRSLKAGSGGLPIGDKALLIGINDYQGTESDLQGTSADVRNVAEALIGTFGWNPDNIYTLLDDKATAENIVTAIKVLLVDSTRPGDQVFLHYSGHGTQITDQNGDESDQKDEVIVSADLNAIPDDLFDEALRLIEDRRVTVIFDSCFSGTATRDLEAPLAGGKLWQGDSSRGLSRAKAPPPDLSNGGLAPPGLRRNVWSAVSDQEIALEDASAAPPRGVFTSRFIEGVAQRRADVSGDGRVTHGELLDYVRRESARYCSSKPGCRSLTPQLEGADGVMRMDVVTGDKVEDPAPPVATAADRVRVSIEPAANFKLGERIRFRIESTMAGHLLLLDFGASGNLTQLFPNSFSDQMGLADRIGPSTPVVIPDEGYGFEIEASPPTGQGHLFAVVTDQPLGLEEIAESRRDLRPIAASDRFLDELSERLRRTRVDANGISTLKFVAAHAPYTITP